MIKRFSLLMLLSACSCEVSQTTNDTLNERYFHRDHDAAQCRAFCEANDMAVLSWTGRGTAEEFCACTPKEECP